MFDVACRHACRLREQSLLHACQTEPATAVKAVDQRLAAYDFLALKARRLSSLEIL